MCIIVYNLMTVMFLSASVAKHQMNHLVTQTAAAVLLFPKTQTPEAVFFFFFNMIVLQHLRQWNLYNNVFQECVSCRICL